MGRDQLSKDVVIESHKLIKKMEVSEEVKNQSQEEDFASLQQTI